MKMRKLILIVPMLLLLGGCAGIAETAIGLPSGVLTQSVQNPVTREHLFRLENGLIVGVTALQAYKNQCENGNLPASCIQVVETLQAYTRRAKPLLRQLRVFVRKNDQVNARVVFTTIQSLIGGFRGVAASVGIPIPTVGAP
jgi:hypothetical protein